MIHTRSTQELYLQYKQEMQKIADIKYSLAVLQWDQETYMPPKGADARARQMATLSETSHQLFTCESFKIILQELISRKDLQDKERKNVSLTWYDYSQQEKLPGEFVRQLSQAVSKSFQSWIGARKGNSFLLFAEDLSGLLDLKKQEADLLGYENHPYDALLNQYERGCTVGLLDRLFSALQSPLKTLLDDIARRPQVNNAFLKQFFPKQLQWEFGTAILSQLGFNFEAGRQDISEHPFTTNFSSQDVRITTRIDENDFSKMTWSCIHECGHALYEQGLPETEYGLPLGEYASLGIHESQSRLWENQVGRSLHGWHHLYPVAQQYFPDQFANITLQSFYKGINKVQPSLIRTEADELTYHFHILIRYELEKKLMEGTLSVLDIPAFWKEQYKNLLGVAVPGDKDGCLQDVHWSHGSFGYFPTYSLGTFYAAQFYAAAQVKVPDLEGEIRKGRYKPLLDWLRIFVYGLGRSYKSEELCVQITGEPLKIEYFLQYALDKYKTIYEF